MSALDPELLDRLRALKPELHARFGVSAMAVFGSRVRGDHRADSDLDIVVDFDTVPRTCLHPGMKEDIERELVPV